MRPRSARPVAGCARTSAPAARGAGHAGWRAARCAHTSVKTSCAPSSASAAALAGDGELRWALRRFELACERNDPSSAERRDSRRPRGAGAEGPTAAGWHTLLRSAPSRRSARRSPSALRTRSRRARAGRGVGPAVDDASELGAELLDHLRTIFRDVLCGHLDSDWSPSPMAYSARPRANARRARARDRGELETPGSCEALRRVV